MADSRVLVAGATGQLGRVITRQLLDAGVKVRALARNAGALAAFAPRAEIAAVDMRDLAKLTEACRGVDQIVATANNNMGQGANSPSRTDLGAYQNLCAAARNTGVRRLVYVSYRGVAQDAPVDIFRIKWYIEDAIRRSGIPWVMLRPTGLHGHLDRPDSREGHPRERRGDDLRRRHGLSPTTSRWRTSPRSPSRCWRGPRSSTRPSTSAVPPTSRRTTSPPSSSAASSRSGKRRHIPVAAMRLLPPLVKPFNEVAARMMTLGLYSATEAKPFPQWKAAADRFGVAPRTVETYVEQMKG